MLNSSQKIKQDCNRRLMIVINPKAGVVANQGADSLIIEEASSLVYHPADGGDGALQAYNIDVRYTQAPGHAVDLAREAVKKDYYGVIACGGDGTVNEVARGVCNSGTALGIIPLGSGNGLARHLGIPMTIKGAMKVIGEDRILNSDYATANGRPFFCTFGAGFDAEVTDKFNRTPGRGLKNYIKTTLEEYFNYNAETYTIIANGKRVTEQAMIVAVCNASQYGNNAYIAPHASIKDGLLDITIVHKGNIFDDTIAAIEMLSGMIGRTTHCTTFQASGIKIIRNRDGAVHFDGEPAILPKLIEVECHHAQFKVFSTANKQRMRPLMAPEIPFVSPLALTLRDLGYKIQNLFQ